MRFPRNAKILRSHFDVAPFAAVFFLLVIFLMLGGLLPTPGIRLQPPTTDNLPGVDKPSIAVAVDEVGHYYFENQMVTEPQLKNSFLAAQAGAREPLTLIIHADKAVSYDQLAHLTLLARDCGLTNSLLATLPRAATKP
jgi:biopolymer transport protein ExbD